MEKDLQDRVTSVFKLFDEALGTIIRTMQFRPALFPAAFSCNLYFLIDQEFIYLAFTNENATGLPQHVFVDYRAEGTISEHEVLDSARDELNFKNPSILKVEASILALSQEAQRLRIGQMAKEYVNECLRAVRIPRATPGYESLQPLLDKFAADHPEHEKNVFIAMRFRVEEQFLEIHNAIRNTLSKYGLVGLRADDKNYCTDGDLWSNICVYMMGCKYGICVFEEINDREFNPNVPLEYGFMRALDRRVLLLKDSRMKPLPADITGKQYYPFDTYKITESISNQVSTWAERDLSLAKPE